MLWDLLFRVLGRDNPSTRVHAKERLRLVLIHDRANVSPSLMNKLKEDLIEVISKYMVIDVEGMEIGLDQDERDVALVANIPVKKIRRDYMERTEQTS